MHEAKCTRNPVRSMACGSQLAPGCRANPWPFVVWVSSLESHPSLQAAYQLFISKKHIVLIKENDVPL